jgi:hypothetical protein
MTKYWHISEGVNTYIILRIGVNGFFQPVRTKAFSLSYPRAGQVNLIGYAGKITAKHE